MRKRTDINDQTFEELEEIIIALRRRVLQLEYTDRELRSQLVKAKERSVQLFSWYTRIQESKE